MSSFHETLREQIMLRFTFLAASKNATAELINNETDKLVDVITDLYGDTDVYRNTGYTDPLPSADLYRNHEKIYEKPDNIQKISYRQIGFLTSQDWYDHMSVHGILAEKASYKPKNGKGVSSWTVIQEPVLLITERKARSLLR